MHDFSESKRIGQRVLYMLSESDVRLIIQERRDSGLKTHHGNDPREGAIVPGVIVADWGGSANLHLFLDGNDSYWPTSRGEFDPKRNGRTRYFIPAAPGSQLEAEGENTEISFEEFKQLAGPNDVGAGEATPVRTVFEPDARGTWIAC